MRRGENGLLIGHGILNNWNNLSEQIYEIMKRNYGNDVPIKK